VGIVASDCEHVSAFSGLTGRERRNLDRISGFSGWTGRIQTGFQDLQGGQDGDEINIDSFF
jgi:hypothetical protein